MLDELDGVERGGAGRQMQERDVVRDLEAGTVMPAGAVEDQGNMHMARKRNQKEGDPEHRAQPEAMVGKITVGFRGPRRRRRATQASRGQSASTV